MEEGDGIRREINISHPESDLYVQLAANKNIKRLSDELYIIGDNGYYIRVEHSDGTKPILRDVSDGKELIAPVKNKLIYSLIF